MSLTPTHPLPETILKALLEKQSSNCVSIYLPMHKSGKEQNMHLAQGMLKQCIRAAEKALVKKGMSPVIVTKYLHPVKALLRDVALWRHPADGMVIFLDEENGMQFHKLPIALEKHTYVGDHYYLLPLLPLYHNNGLFYLLQLSRDYVRLHEASRFGMRDIFIEDYAPNRLEEAVGSDFRQKMLQFRSGQDSFGGGAFHGHGEGKDDEKKELAHFFRLLDKGVKSAIPKHDAPLVLACTDDVFDRYRKTSSYPNIYPHNISGDPEFISETQLHNDGWNLVASYFFKTREEKRHQFHEAVTSAKVATITDDIVKAAVDGKVDTLFVGEGTDLFGNYDTSSREVRIADRPGPTNYSLTNLAAVTTFRQGGKVFILPKKDMPAKASPLNALLRY